MWSKAWHVNCCAAYRMADDAAAECLFERLRLYQQRAPDSAEVARAITARINSRLSSHGEHATL